VEPLKFSEEESKTFRTEFAPKATDSQWQLFRLECERRNLTPGKHVVFSTRSSQVWDVTLGQSVNETKVAFITTIEALRLLAERGGKYQGRGPFKFYYLDKDELPSIQSEIPLGLVPHAVSVTGRRRDWLDPVFAVARYEAYVQTKKTGGKDVPTKMWVKRAEEQCAKCAEASMLRTLAPEDTGGLYLSEEMPEDERKMETDLLSVTSPAIVPHVVIIPQVNFDPATELSPVLTEAMPQTISSSSGANVISTQPSMLDFIESAMPNDAEAAATAALQAAVVVEKPGIKKSTNADIQESQRTVTLSPVDTIPTPAQMKDFYAQCKHISHDILPKTGATNGGDILRAWLLRRSGKHVIKELTVGQWQSGLAAITAVGPEPASILNLLKG